MVTDGNEIHEKIVGIRKREPFEMFAGSFEEKNAEALPFFTIKRIGIAIFCRLKDVFCFTGD